MKVYVNTMTENSDEAWRQEYELGVHGCNGAKHFPEIKKIKNKEYQLKKGNYDLSFQIWWQMRKECGKKILEMDKGYHARHMAFRRKMEESSPELETKFQALLGLAKSKGYKV